MPEGTRSSAEVQAEIDALYAAAEEKGKKPHGAKIGSLRKDLKVAQLTERVAELESGTSQSVSEAPYTTGTMTSDSRESSLDSAYGELPPGVSPEIFADPGEWRFIERCCSESGDVGIKSRPFKSKYMDLVRKIEMRRAIIQVMATMDSGKFPEFSALGRDDSTGRKVAPKPTKAERQAQIDAEAASLSQPDVPKRTGAGEAIGRSRPTNAEIMSEFPDPKQFAAQGASE